MIGSLIIACVVLYLIARLMVWVLEGNEDAGIVIGEVDDTNK